MKERQNFSIDSEILKDFKKLCDEKSINMSKLIQNMIKEFLDNNK